MYVHLSVQTWIELGSPNLVFKFILTLSNKFFFLLLSKVQGKGNGLRVSLCFIFVCSSHNKILTELRSPNLVIKLILTYPGLQLLLVSMVKIQRSRSQSNFACFIAVITKLVIILTLSRISFSYFKSLNLLLLFWHYVVFFFFYVKCQSQSSGSQSNIWLG